MQQELFNVKDQHKQLIIGLMEEKNKTGQLEGEIHGQIQMLKTQTQKLDLEKETLNDDIEKMQKRQNELLMLNKSAKRLVLLLFIQTKCWFLCQSIITKGKY